MAKQKIVDRFKRYTKKFIPARYRRYLTARLFWAFAVFLIAAWLFAWIAKEVRDLDTTHFDEWVLLSIRRGHTDMLDQIVVALTHLGGVIFVPIASLALAAVFYRKLSPEHCWLLLTGVIGSSLINLALKSVFARARPDLWTHIVTEHSFSFPSGHAMASASLAASLVGALWFSRWRKWVISLGMLYIAVVGFTRLYLGVHYPTDIFAGWIIATAWVALVWIIFADAPATKETITDPSKVPAPDHSRAR